MEEPQSSNEFENFCKPKRGYTKHKTKQEDGSQSHISGSRRTRSQIAPDWTTKDALILVNEVAAVEGDCKKALSTFQKWKIVVNNCTILGVSRTLNQYRRKWESLLVEYKKIKECESQLSNTSYWSLDSETRNEFGLPENFSEELYTAINVFLRVQGERSDTDPESDPEAEADMLDAIVEQGPKKQKQHLMLQYGCSEENYPHSHPEEIHRRSPIEERPQKSYIEENGPKKQKQQLMLQYGCCEENYPKSHPEEFHIDQRPRKTCVEEKPLEISTEEKEKMMAAKLREKAELIHAIVKGTNVENAEYGASDFRNNENFRGEFVKGQGDKLIACLGDIANTLNELCDLVQE